MDRTTIEPAIRILITEIRARLTNPADRQGRRSLCVGGQCRRRGVGFDGDRAVDL